MPYLLKSRKGPFIMRDGIEAKDPMIEVSTKAWVPFRHLQSALQGRDGDLGNAEVDVREIDDDQYEHAVEFADIDELTLEGRPVVAPKHRPKPKPKEETPSEPTAPEQPRPASMALTVDEEKLERRMADRRGEGEESPPDAFETDTDESATEPHDRPPVGQPEEPPAASEPKADDDQVDAAEAAEAGLLVDEEPKTEDADAPTEPQEEPSEATEPEATEEGGSETEQPDQPDEEPKTEDADAPTEPQEEPKEEQSTSRRGSRRGRRGRR